MPFNKKSALWQDTQEHFFRDTAIRPVKQIGPHCVSTVLAMLTGRDPVYFQNDSLNTQDPVSWSGVLNPFGMKLAYCPFDVRKIKFYMDELIRLDDLFLLCYYSPIGPEILKDPDENGWVCSSHVVILHRDKILDPMRGDMVSAKEHDCNGHHTKRLFRVVPADHPRGL